MRFSRSILTRSARTNATELYGLILLVGIALLADGCGGSSDSTAPASAGPPSSISIVSGNGQTGVVDAELSQPLRVRVLDANGAGVPNLSVTFAIVSGAGKVFTSVSTTNSEGLAADRWTLGQKVAVPQSVEARAINNSTGAVLSVSFDATALPGPAISLSRLSPDTRILAPSDTAQIALSGQDTFGNAITMVQLATVFQSANTAVATVGINGTVTALQAGTADIVATVGSLQALTRVFVDGSVQVVYPYSGLYFVSGRGTTSSLVGGTSPGGLSSTLSAGRWNGSGFSFDGPTETGAFTSGWLAPDGTVWASGNGGCSLSCGLSGPPVWRSSTVGQWQRMNVGSGAPQTRESWISGADPSVVVYSTVQDQDRPYMYLWSGTAWQDLLLPQTTPDSAFQAVFPIARSATEIYGIGPLEGITARYAGRARAAAVRWDGTSWSFISVPPPPAGTVWSGISRPLALAPGAPLRVFVQSWDGSAYHFQLVELSGATSTLLPFTLPSGFTSIQGYAITPSGALILSEGAKVSQQTTSGWKTIYLRGGWITDGQSMWQGNDGVIWTGVARRLPGTLKTRKQ